MKKTMSDDELKPCPFCGLQPVRNELRQLRALRDRVNNAVTPLTELGAWGKNLGVAVEELVLWYEVQKQELADAQKTANVFRGLLADALDKDRWIPVEERLPEPGVPVLMWLHPRHIPGQAKEGTYMPVLNPDRSWRSTWDMSTYETGEITHWRPMPSVPNVEDE